MMYLEFHSDWSLIVSLFLIQLCGVKLRSHGNSHGNMRELLNAI